MKKHREDANRTGQHVPPNILIAEIRTKVWLEISGGFVIGEGGLDLLRLIAQLGSLTAAAHEIGWSYRHAWGYLRNAERQLGTPLVVTSAGKGSQRGTALSAAGTDILQKLDAARKVVHTNAIRYWMGAARPSGRRSQRPRRYQVKV